MQPCFFFNTGGCFNKDGTVKTNCKYKHVIVDYPIERPQHTKPPCKYFHLHKHCKNESCTFGHVELNQYNWEKYFARKWPGKGYSANCVWKELPGAESPAVDFKITLLMILYNLLNE